MYKPNTPMQPKPRPARADCCPEPDCTCGLRNNYYVGKRLTPDAFSIEQRYHNGRRHLLNRTLFGEGVVKGYAVACAQDELAGQPPGCLVVSTGLALDAVGHELLNTETVVLRMEDVIVLDASGRPVAKCKGGKVPPQREGWWKLCVHYAERPVGRTTVHDECSCERHPFDRVCETVRFSLAPMKDFAECCETPGCSFQCRCPEGECCKPAPRRTGDTGKPSVATMEPQKPVEAKIEAARQAQPVLAERDPSAHRPGIEVPVHEASAMQPVPRGGCECLCHAVSRPLDGCDEPCLTPIDEVCGPVCVDLHDCVALACVQLVVDSCGDAAFGTRVEPCGPRPLVLNNRLLFDLIRGCDLTRMNAEWERVFRGEGDPVPWELFRKSFGTYDKEKGLLTGDGIYRVTFTRPVFASTLRPECFAMTVIVRREETRWGRVLRVPIVGLVPIPEPGSTELVRGAQLRFDSVWYGDEIDSGASVCNDEIALVEIEVRGGRIIDCNGLAVDVDANGTPGGESFVAFRVGPPPPSVDDEKQPGRWMEYPAPQTDQAA